MRQNTQIAAEVNGLIYPFRDQGVAMRTEGFAVLPAKGKAPLVKGFTDWKGAPREATVEKWAERMPDKNLVYVPGLSKAKRGDNGLVVVDGDDAEAVQKVEAIFGPTPGMVNTRRGKHFLYRATERSLGKITSLKKYGINADVKHGNSIVVGPPSFHEKDVHFSYSWDGCDATVIRDLPTFDVAALQALIDGQQVCPNKVFDNVTLLGRPPQAHDILRNGMRDGSRGLSLNDALCKHVAFCSDFNELLDKAVTHCMALCDQHGVEMLPHAEVVERAQAVWNDHRAGKIERFAGFRATAQVGVDEVRYLTAVHEQGDSAMALLTLFRGEHGARMDRGETFKIMCDAMAEAETLGLWSARKYRIARDILIEHGFIEVVVAQKGRKPAEYRLCERRHLPSLERQRAAAKGRGQ